MKLHCLVVFLFILAFSQAVQLPQCTSNCSVANCAQCTNGTCTTCFNGYSLTLNSCSINTCNIPNCSLCDSNGACLKCANIQAVYNASSGTCTSGCSVPNCKTCKHRSSFCEECSTGFARYQWNDQCITAPIPHCTVVYDFQQQEFLCAKCEEGYRPTKDRMECMTYNSNCSVIPDCLSCSSSSVCLSCRVGYSLSNGSALCAPNACAVPGCLYCASNGTCLRCFSNKTMVGSSCNEAACTLSNCATCKPNSLFCDACKSGFMLNVWTRQCETYTINITNCVAFMMDSNNQLRCIQCGLGLVPSSDQFSCVANCPSGCLNCTNSTFCSSCGIGHSLLLGACSPNNCTASNCILCASNQTCLQCDAYSTLTNGSCVVSCSLSSCSLCQKDSHECEQCVSGYALNSWSHMCMSSPISGCAKVLDYSQQQFLCTKCSSGLIPTSDQLACLPNCTVANCLNCSGSNCSACRPGFQLSTGKTCSKINCSIANCLLCESALKCTRCSSNFTLSSGQCVAAQCSLANCGVCKTGSIFCDVCSSGYVLNIWLGTCEKLTFSISKCLAFRKDSSNQNRCVQCSNALVPSSDGFSCVLNCPVHCSACSNGVCSACDQGYYIKNGSCSAYNCSSDCSVCDSNGTCLTCLNSAQTYSSSLKACQSACSLPHCSSCLAGSEVCLQCASGYSLYGWNGECRLTLIANCLQLYDFRGNEYLCLACAKGYVPTKDQSECMLANCSLIEDCQTCNISSVCSSCRVGYSLTSNKTACVPNSCSVPNCLYCGSNSTCLRCSSAFNLIGGQCRQAYCKLPFCSSCKQHSQHCDACMSGYSWNIWTNQCQKSIVASCDSEGSVSRGNYQCFSCPANQTCNQCNSAYLNLSGTCTPSCNVSNCAKCINAQYCSECANGFVLSADFLACRLQCTVANCSKCTKSISVCDVCAAGFALSSNVCSADICSIEYCLLCATSTTCKSCASMFKLASNGTCVSSCPITNCRVCSSNIKCDTCNLGYAMTSPSSCSPICSISNCLLCSSSLTCASCTDGFVLSADSSSCKAKCLDSNCAQCSGLDNCTACLSGFTVTSDDSGKGFCTSSSCPIGFYSNNSQCVSCSVTGCDICASVSTCSLCKPTFYLSNNTCASCSASFSNCLVCSSTSCLQCMAGFVLNSKRLCLALGNCSNGCISCSNGTNGTCTECIPSFYLNSAGGCSPKCSNGPYSENGCGCQPGFYRKNEVCTACRDSNCLTCDQMSCSKCAAGFYPLMDSCLKCIPNCHSCSTASICDKCELGYKLSDYQCKFNYVDTNSTNMCPLGCSQCSFRNRVPYCSRLEEGFAYGFNSSIVQCSPSCKTCASNNASLCLSCYSGLLSFGTCVSCNDANCRSCSQDVFSCSECNTGYTLSSGVCSACASNCLKCNTQGPGFCDEGGCTSGYASSSFSHLCTKCLNGCNTCSSQDFTACLTCTKGSYLSNGACLSCPSGCSTCSSGTVCGECSLGYELRLGACYLIPELPCSQNDANNSCIACIDNYQLVNSSCQIITSNICNSNCSQCPFGYYLTNSSCMACPNISNCLQCDVLNPSLCLRCASGYYWNGSICTACAANCQLCFGASKCFSAKAGYYLIRDAQGALTGSTGKCKSTCATCSDDNHCTSCATNWKLAGVECVSPESFNVTLVVIPTFISWNQSWTASTQQSNALKNWPQIYAKIQQLLNINSTDQGVLMTKSLTCGSISTEVTRIVGSGEDATAVRSALTSSLQSGTSGLTVVSTSLSTSQQKEDNTNTSLIVGLVVGVGGFLIIAILVIIYCVYLKKKEEEINNKIKQTDIIEMDTPKAQFKEQVPNKTRDFGTTKFKEGLTPSKISDIKEKNASQVNLTEENQRTGNKLLSDIQPSGFRNPKLVPIKKVEPETSPANSRLVLIDPDSTKKMTHLSSMENTPRRPNLLPSIQEIEKISGAKKVEEGDMGELEVEFKLNPDDFNQ